MNPMLKIYNIPLVYLICIGIPSNTVAHSYVYTINMVDRHVLWSNVIQKFFLLRQGQHLCEVFH